MKSRCTAPPSLGLSPRVRGNRAQLDQALHRDGSIPACAGEPVNAPDMGFSIAVYPRVCGGTLARFVFALIPIGLSPRVRGNPYVGQQLLEARRSIPACAGEPPCLVGNTNVVSVYPRVCGGTIVLVC